MNSTFDLQDFLGYVLLEPDGKSELRPRIEVQLYFASENDFTVVVPESLFPVGLLYFDAGRQAFRVQMAERGKQHGTG